MLRVQKRADKNKLFFIPVLLISLILIGCGGGSAGSSGQSSSPPASGIITLNWNAPTTNQDGTPLTDLGGFMVYYGTSSGKYDSSVDVGNSTTFSLTSLTSGLYCFVLTAYDTSRNESGYSREVCKTVD